ncbi:hydantoinase/oxoprolinase family protein [Arthrobacter cryoconiti]|uniref:Hydantoinase/oxoprolinase family protein n=1 Tax=Arthrobacter cryoconiti TaxID=748907 RepID=A0ABV8QZS1_9MICC|nr:hydantoinase/oxoprolinase family protein [Arthrobacter cryoconiti]MCC9068603.1 hydantoinase/oxoprolinase family protein [Arthrobacter cryoconiti]
MAFRVAMDIGGTFTDIVVHDTETGNFTASKADTTPGRLTDGVLQAITQLRIEPGEIEYFVHGTTQGLNALLERKGANVMLITNEGMRDVYTIARGNRTRMFDIHYRKQKPLVAREDTFGVGGRVKADGTELYQLDEQRVHELAVAARERGYESIAVCLLFSFLAPEHELRIEEILREVLGEEIMIVLSHRVSGEWREYERTSSTVLEAYTGPVVRNYLEQIGERFVQTGISAQVQVMQSSGGIVSADFARQHPLQTLLSGPVGGAAGGAALSKVLATPHAICIDMGGTSFDVSLILNHAPDITTDGSADGFPVLMPLVNLHTIGAGGGSIARCAGGGLRVGPDSAGATPGPASYGRGGTEPTITDANVVLGRVDPDWFAGGRMTLDGVAASVAVERLGAEIGLGTIEAAEGVLDIANATMAQAIRTLTVEHGLEPTDFTLIAFGGAGPMHAEGIARELGVTRVIVPEYPGAFSAWGMLGADVRRDFSHQFYVQRDLLDGTELQVALRKLGDEAREVLTTQAITTDMQGVEYALDMRYIGQDYTLSIPLLGLDEVVGKDFIGDIASRFERSHRSRYGHANGAAPFEIVNIRVTGTGKSPHGHITGGSALESGGVVKNVAIVFNGETHTAPVYKRSRLIPGQRIMGPAIVLEETTTTVISPLASLTREVSGVLTMEVHPRA